MKALRTTLRPMSRLARPAVSRATRLASTTAPPKPTGKALGMPVPVEAYPLIFIVSFMCGAAVFGMSPPGFGPSLSPPVAVVTPAPERALRQADTLRWAPSAYASERFPFVLPADGVADLPAATRPAAGGAFERVVGGFL
ncbi:hypothetical protein Q5752_003220 [Cryptotrichosporon argae]